jgi:hypothetical protein
MRKGWKKLAERGDGKLHTPEQVREAIPIALADDWRAERCDDFMREVKAILVGTDQNTLFKLLKAETLEALNKVSGSGFPLRGMLKACLVQAVQDGHTGEAAMVKGTADGLALKCGAGGRQVEEHYLRVSNDRRATHVRGRIEDGATATDFNVMARQFCKLEKAPPVKRYDDIDEGVLNS